MFEDDEFPVKWLDTKSYVRVGADGLPQLVQIEPIFSDAGNFLPQSVRVYIDDVGPLIMDRGSAEAMVSSSHCTPLEVNAQWKHLLQN